MPPKKKRPSDHSPAGKGETVLEGCARTAPEAPEEAKPESNFDRLVTHLHSGSLAYRLVQAYRDQNATDPAESMKAVLRKRLEEVRRSIDHPKA